MIQKAIAMLEIIAGEQSPTDQDLARNNQPSDPTNLHGQLDCIDESINTTRYLELLAARGLLQHHRVIDRAFRRSLFNQHWAGQLVDIKSQNRYVVDSWFGSNGTQPHIGLASRWEDLSVLNRYRRSTQ